MHVSRIFSQSFFRLAVWVFHLSHYEQCVEPLIWEWPGQLKVLLVISHSTPFLRSRHRPQLMTKSKEYFLCLFKTFCWSWNFFSSRLASCLPTRVEGWKSVGLCCRFRQRRHKNSEPLKMQVFWINWNEFMAAFCIPSRCRMFFSWH